MNLENFDPSDVDGCQQLADAMKRVVELVKEALQQDQAQQLIPDRSRKDELEARKTSFYKYMIQIKEAISDYVQRT